MFFLGLAVRFVVIKHEMVNIDILLKFELLLIFNRFVGLFVKTHSIHIEIQYLRSLFNFSFNFSAGFISLNKINIKYLFIKKYLNKEWNFYIFCSILINNHLLAVFEGR